MAMTLDTSSEYFGGCPECGTNDGFLFHGRDNWFVCDTHQTKWLIGSNLFSGYLHMTDQELAWQRDRLAGYREVEQIYVDRHILLNADGTPVAEGAEIYDSEHGLIGTFAGIRDVPGHAEMMIALTIPGMEHRDTDNENLFFGACATKWSTKPIDPGDSVAEVADELTEASDRPARTERWSKEGLLEHYATREPKSFVQIDGWVSGDDAIVTDDDGLAMSSGLTTELMNGSTVRLLIKPDSDPTKIVVLLHRAIEEIEDRPETITTSHWLAPRLAPKLHLVEPLET